MTIYKAIPTDYEGIRFRSKSEAIFARAMTLSGLEWEYEPDAWAHYLVDFGVKAKAKNWSPTMRYLIEYKPKEPSQAYIDKLEKLSVPPDYDALFIFYGSPYNSKIGFFPMGDASTAERVAFILLVANPIWSHLMEAKDYRFDLKHEEVSEDRIDESLKKMNLDGAAAMIWKNSCLSWQGTTIELYCDSTARKLLTDVTESHIRTELLRVLDWAENVEFTV